MTYKLLYKDASENADEHLRDIIRQMRVSHVCWLYYQHPETGKVVPLFISPCQTSQTAKQPVYDQAAASSLTYPTLGRPTIPVQLRFKGRTIGCQAALLNIQFTG